MKFRKKPVVVEAFKYTKEYYEKVWGTSEQPNFMVMYPDHATIRTLEGEMRAELGDWIICGLKGEFYPCKPDIFEATYEPAESSHEN